MSRIHYFSFLVDDHGHPLPGVDVSIFLAGTETPARIFDTEFGGTYNSTAPQLITNAKGYFEFWISNMESVNGYSYGQKFKIKWEKPGISSGYIDWIDIFPLVLPVDETNFEDTVKNKLVSDQLAFGWETHTNYDVTTDGFPVHGFEAFDPDGDENSFLGLFTTEQKQVNKIISDKYAYTWDNHSKFSFSSLSSSSFDTSATSATSFSLAASGDLDGFYPDTYNITAHGLQPVEFNDDDIYFNKLVSNYFMTQFASRDGIQSFTAPVSGIYPTNQNHLATKEYVEDYMTNKLLILETTEKTADYTLAIGDEGFIVPMNASAESNLIIPEDTTTNFAIGTVIGILNLSSNIVNIVGESVSVTVRNSGALNQNNEASVRKRAANDWIVIGSTT